MIAEMWESFPRLMEQNINALLDEAIPTPRKAFQLYKELQREDLWNKSYEEFSRNLTLFYSKSRAYREKSDFDGFLERPLPHIFYEKFHLNFHSAQIDPLAIHELAVWAHNVIRVGSKKKTPIIAPDVFSRTLDRLTKPLPHEKAEDLDFDDFCAGWRKTVFQLYGALYEAELNALVNELKWLKVQIEESEKRAREQRVFPTIYLTQTEIDWTLAVRQAASTFQPAPKFPLSRGPQKPRLIDLERTTLLYNVVLNTRIPELLKHRDNLRTTLLARCDGLMGDRAA